MKMRTFEKFFIILIYNGNQNTDYLDHSPRNGSKEIWFSTAKANNNNN